MKQKFVNGTVAVAIFAMAACALFSLCAPPMVTAQVMPRDFIVPTWMREMRDENLTDAPDSLVRPQDGHLASVWTFLQGFFGSQNQVEQAKKQQKTQGPMASTEFFCRADGARSPTKPTSVHQLRPGDVDVIGAIGDSSTVGTGSFSVSLPQLLVEHRGSSWTGGGQDTWREFLTLPNILKVFNPMLLGYAYGDSLSQQLFSQFNVAEVGAITKDIPFMAREIVDRMKRDERVNVDEDWKLITIMMGASTYCLEMCYASQKDFPEKHKQAYLQSLLYIKANLPRTMVNLVLSPGLDYLRNQTKLPSACHLTRLAECPCLFSKQFRRRQTDFDDMVEQMQQIEREIAENEELRNTEDFAVVLQTFTEEFQFPVNESNGTDLSYLSVDCLHFSQKGYARAANALWNNMLEPVGSKSTDWSKEFDRFLCPTDESPYIRTWKNSAP